LCVTAANRSGAVTGAEAPWRPSVGPAEPRSVLIARGVSVGNAVREEANEANTHGKTEN
jgi:hypothetical protein